MGRYNMSYCPICGSSADPFFQYILHDIALQDAVVPLPPATSMNNLGSNVLGKDRQELHTPTMSEHNFTKKGKYRTPTAVATTEKSPMQPKSLAGVKANSASGIQDTNSATTMGPPLLALNDSETNAAITTSPIQLHASLLEKPVNKPAPQGIKKGVSHVPKVGRGTLPHSHASFTKPSLAAQHPPSRPCNNQVKEAHSAFPTEMMMMPPGVKKSTTQKQNSTRARVSHARPVCVNTKPKTVRKMDTLYCEVLCWDPSRFMFPQEGPDGKIIRPCPVWTEEPVPVPEVFESYERYCDVFSPLLRLEVWEDVSHPMINVLTMY